MSTPLYPAGRAAQPARRRLPVKSAAVTVLVFVAALWLIEAIDVADGGALDQWGIRPRDEEGLRGIAFAPVLHASWEHLTSNSVPALVLGFVGLLAGVARFVSATAIVWVLSGVGVWLTGENGTIVIGLSGVLFGWMTYLVVRGFFNRSLVEIAVGVVLLVLYGGMLWGVLPGQAGVSWQAHLFGALAGVVAAALLGRGRNTKSTQVGAIATG